MRNQILEFRLCPDCTALMPVNAGRCAQCGGGALTTVPLGKPKGRMKHAIARLREQRYERKKIAVGLCPNCCAVMPDDAPRCRQCDWNGDPVAEAASPSALRSLADSVRAALTYEKIVHCTYCDSNVRATTHFCPDCLNPFLSKTAAPSALAQAGARIRQQRAKQAVERATLCPICEIYLPDWSDQCYCCGWTRPVGGDVRSTLRFLVKSTRQKVDQATRQAARRLKPQGDLCPDCDVYVPLSDPMCMICGCKPDRKRSFTGSLRALRVGRARKAVSKRQKRMRICEECDLPIRAGYANCMACGWKPAPNALQRLRAVRLRPRKAMVSGVEGRLCPNCRTSIEEDARGCGHCGWDRDPARTWARHPKMIWLVPIGLLLYGILHTTFLHMADPLSTFGHFDQYGRTGADSNKKQLTSARAER